VFFDWYFSVIGAISCDVSPKIILDNQIVMNCESCWTNGCLHSLWKNLLYMSFITFFLRIRL